MIVRVWFREPSSECLIAGIGHALIGYFFVFFVSLLSWPFRHYSVRCALCVLYRIRSVVSRFFVAQLCLYNVCEKGRLRVVLCAAIFYDHEQSLLSVLFLCLLVYILGLTVECCLLVHGKWLWFVGYDVLRACFRNGRSRPDDSCISDARHLYCSFAFFV